MAEAADAMARFALLRSPPGGELLSLLAEQSVTPDTALRLGTELRRRYPADLVAAAIAQHELRLQARAKFSRAMQMFFTRPGLEQSSSEVVARHRAARYASFERVADLCCGIGGDLLALAQGRLVPARPVPIRPVPGRPVQIRQVPGRRVLAVDRDLLHLRMAEANAEAYGVEHGVTTSASDARDADLAGQVAAVGIKAAPGIARDAVPEGWELEFVAVGRDLKEATAWSPALATAARRATILPEGHTLTPRPGAAVAVRTPGAFLLDPSPAVTRAGLVEELARMLGAWKIDEQIAFLSNDVTMDTPFGRTLRVIDSAPWNQKQLPGRLRALDIGAADIRRRGLAGDVDQLHRSLKLSGTRRATIVMTRVQDRPWGLICVAQS